MLLFAYICANAQLPISIMLPLFHTTILDITFADIFIYPIWDLICKLWWLLWNMPITLFAIVLILYVITIAKGDRKLPW